MPTARQGTGEARRARLPAAQGAARGYTYPGPATARQGDAAASPAILAMPRGVKVGNDEILFAGDPPTAGDAARPVSVRRDGREVLSLAGKDIDLDRSQGDIGLFVPDAGYPFGEIPDWLIKQRAKRPDWAK